MRSRGGIRWILALIGATCMTLSGLGVPAAQAIPQPCPDGAICFCDGLNGTGEKRGAWQGDPGLPWFGYLAFNDRTDSVINNTQWTWHWYPHVNYGGSPRSIPPRKDRPQNVSPADRNTMSSAKQCYCF